MLVIQLKRFIFSVTFQVWTCNYFWCGIVLEQLVTNVIANSHETIFFIHCKKIQSVKMSTFLLNLLKKQNFQNVAVQKLNSVCLLDHNSSLLYFICSWAISQTKNLLLRSKQKMKNHELKLELYECKMHLFVKYSDFLKLLFLFFICT